MNIRRLQGWALIVSAVIDLVALFHSDSPVFSVIFVIGALCFMFGVPVIESVQHAGVLDWVGIALLELGAAIPIAANIVGLSGGAAFGSGILFTSALSGALGRVIVGGLTAQKRVFAPWIGWAFIVEGLLNFVGGILQVPALAFIGGVVVPVLGAAALFGYGWEVVQNASRPVAAI